MRFKTWQNGELVFGGLCRTVGLYQFLVFSRSDQIVELVNVN